MLRMPVLTSERLRVRPLALDDFDAMYQILDVDVQPGEPAIGSDESTVQAKRLAWLAWTIASEEQLASLDQPPYGERAIERIEDGVVVGACGLVPSLAPFGRLPTFPESDLPSTAWRPEVGLFWSVGAQYRGRGVCDRGRAQLDRLRLWNAISGENHRDHRARQHGIHQGDAEARHVGRSKCIRRASLVPGVWGAIELAVNGWVPGVDTGIGLSDGAP